MVCFPCYGRWTHDLHLYYCRAVVRIHIYISGIKTLSHIYRMRTIVLEAFPGRLTVSRLPHPPSSNSISFRFMIFTKQNSEHIITVKFTTKNIKYHRHTSHFFFSISLPKLLFSSPYSEYFRFLLWNLFRARAFTGGEPLQPGPIAVLPATSATARTLLALPHVTSPCTACAAADSLVRAQTRSLVCFGSAVPGLCQHCKAGAAA